MNGYSIICWFGWAYLGLSILGVIALGWGLVDPKTEVGGGDKPPETLGHSPFPPAPPAPLHFNTPAATNTRP